MKKKRLLGLASAAAIVLASLPSFSLSAFAKQRTGTTDDGYDWELWSEDDRGTTEMTPGANGTFTCRWEGCKNCLFRSGKKFKDYPQWDTLDGIQVTYNVDFHGQGNTYLCIYGWTKNPMVEYYIVETYGEWKPPGGQGYKGTLTANDGEYEIYSCTHQGPSIEKDWDSFPQYWSVRKNGRTSGVIDIDKHFEAWEKAGMKMGGLYEVALNCEGYGGDQYSARGSATVKQNDLKFGIDPSQTVKYTKPSGSGTGISDEFEGTGSDWKGKGTSEYGLTSDYAFEGKNSFYVTGRKATSDGIQCSGGSELEPGGTYNITAFCSYKDSKYSSLTYTVGLNYKRDGTEVFDELDDAVGGSEQWVDLQKDFTVPEGATDISLSIQTKNKDKPGEGDLLPFFVDHVVLSRIIVDTTTSTTTTITTETPPHKLVRGDVDVNDKVQIADAVLLARYIAEDPVVVSAEGRVNAELTGDSKLDADDLAALLVLIATT